MYFFFELKIRIVLLSRKKKKKTYTTGHVSETWPFGWVKSEHKKPCLFHFPSLTTSFKILHWDSQAVKTRKRGWSAKSVVEKHKEERGKKEGEEGHIRELRKKQNQQVKKIFKDFTKSLNCFYLYSCSNTFNFSEIYKTMEVFYFGPVCIYRPKFGIRSGVNSISLVVYTLRQS